MTVRYRGRHFFDRIGANFIEGLPQMITGNQYFVSALNGSDTNAGTSPDKPLKTIGAARTKNTADYAAAGYLAKPMNVIWVEPGVYDEYFNGGFYYCWVVGLGVRGTDSQAEIHPSTVGGVFRADATFLASGFLNMWFESDIVSVPIFDLGICNNSKIVSCVFALGADVAGVKAIDTVNCTHLLVEDCDFESGQGTYDLDYSIYHRGGADKYAHQCRYINNRMLNQSGGIYQATDCTATGAIARDNLIRVKGTGIGIDGKGGGADTGGEMIAVNNEIIIEGAGDAIHGLAAGKKLYNKTIVNGTFAYETVLA